MPMRELGRAESNGNRLLWNRQEDTEGMDTKMFHILVYELNNSSK
jgi:hypothetical protein